MSNEASLAKCSGCKELELLEKRAQVYIAVERQWQAKHHPGDDEKSQENARQASGIHSLPK